MKQIIINITQQSPFDIPYGFSYVHSAYPTGYWEYWGNYNGSGLGKCNTTSFELNTGYGFNMFKGAE